MSECLVGRKYRFWIRLDRFGCRGPSMYVVEHEGISFREYIAHDHRNTTVALISNVCTIV